MENGNANGALRLTLQTLILKHPEAQQTNHEVMSQGPKKQIPSIIYEDIDEDLVEKSTKKTLIWRR